MLSHSDIHPNVVWGFQKVEIIIRKCLKSSPVDRYATVDLLIHDLDALLADMKFQSHKQVLAAFLADPSDWTEKNRTAVVDRTIDLGIQAKKKKQHQEAAAHFNRVLALDPGKEKALLHITGMNRNRMVRRVLERTAIVLTILTAIAAVAWIVLRPKPAPPVPPQVEEPEISRDQAAPPEPASQDTTGEEDEPIQTAESINSIPAEGHEAK